MLQFFTPQQAVTVRDISVTFLTIKFCFDRKLRKARVTRIHMNLFASMILQSFVRLVIYADQYYVGLAATAKDDEIMTQVNKRISSVCNEVLILTLKPGHFGEYFHTPD